ncbi:MAG: ABC transporter substrate-binding protein [Deltaproteobacteria bacterium]|nr:ABC transporter substrate-binding protein [Deltaproteobacteria bacterium]
MKQARLFTALLVVLTMMFAFGAGSTMAADKVVKVGVTAPLTGPYAMWGRDTKAAIEMAFEAIGYKIGDYKFELVWIDDQSDPAKATNAFSEAVERKGITVAFYDVNSSVSVALLDVVAQYKIPLFFPLGAADTINKQWLTDPKKYSYFGGKGWPMPQTLCAGYVESINNAVKKGLWKPETKKVAIYGEDTDWGRSLGGEMAKGFKKGGWEVVSQDFFPQSQVDFYPILSKYKEANVSVVAGAAGSIAAMSAFIKQARELSLKAAIIGDQLGGFGDWYKMVGADSDGVLDMVPQLVSPAAKKWAEAFKAKYGFEVSPSSTGQAYDYANYFIKVARRVLEKYNNMDRESFYKVLIEEVNTGKLTFSQQDGALIHKMYKYTPESMPDPVVGPDYYFFPVLQYFGGKGYVVFPEEGKDKDIVLK